MKGIESGLGINDGHFKNDRNGTLTIGRVQNASGLKAKLIAISDTLINALNMYIFATLLTRFYHSIPRIHI